MRAVMKRKHFLKLMATVPLTIGMMKLTELDSLSRNFGRTEKMPALFLGHGHPMNALYDNDFTRRLEQLGKEIERPNAILMLSAHWQTRGTIVSTNPWPKTIYDFGRFDERLFDIKYEPQGYPELAKKVVTLVKNADVKEDDTMGLDHGAWGVLKFLYPEQDIPVFQLSIDATKGGNFQYQLGKQIKSLREKGVLIIGSGNIVHNLRRMDWYNIDANPFDFTVAFDTQVKKLIESRNFDKLINYQNLGTAAAISIPTEDHYVPMLFTLGLVDKSDEIEQIYEGYQYGGISMRCFKIG